MTYYALVLIVATVVSFGLSVALWQIGTRFDVRREVRSRDVHKEPVPRLGGLALFGSLLVATLVASQVSWFEGIFSDSHAVWALVGAAAVVVAIGESAMYLRTSLLSHIPRAWIKKMSNPSAARN